MDGSSPYVLVVDDEAESANAVGRILKREFDARVEMVPDATSFIGLMSQLDRFDLIILDYRLPDGDGLSLLDNVRSVPGAPPVIMITGQDSEDIATLAFRIGAADYVKKGHDTHKLLVEAVDRVLTSQGKRLPAT
jgi:two-component system, NarL family, sensor histidine kinase BarA